MDYWVKTCDKCQKIKTITNRNDKKILTNKNEDLPWDTSYVDLFALSWYVGIRCKFITDWIESNPSRVIIREIYHPTLEIRLGDVFWKQHSIMRTLASLYLDSSFVTARQLFSPRVFPRPYNPIYQTYSNQIKCLMHWFHQVIGLLTLTCAKYHQLFKTIILFLWPYPS